jgi:hypothetical protein
MAILFYLYPIINKAMAETYYYIKTKDAAGEAEIEALSSKGKIEILPPDFIPQWQQEESLRRLSAMKAHPEKNISLEEFLAEFEKDEIKLSPEARIELLES